MFGKYNKFFLEFNKQRYKANKIEILTLVFGFLGALAWFSPWVYDKLTKTDLEIKLISQYGSVGSLNTPDVKISKGNMYLMKFAIVSKNKGFDYRDINIKIKFSSVNKLFEGKTYTAKDSYYTLMDSNKPVLKKLVINQDEELIYNCYMEKDKPLIGYVSFVIDTVINEDYEKLVVEFINFDNKKITKEIESKDIKGSRLFFDDKIWEDASLNEIK